MNYAHSQVTSRGPKKDVIRLVVDENCYVAENKAQKCRRRSKERVRTRVTFGDEFITGTLMGPVMLVELIAHHTPYLTSFKWQLVGKQDNFCSPVPVNM